MARRGVLSRRDLVDAVLDGESGRRALLNDLATADDPSLVSAAIGLIDAAITEFRTEYLARVPYRSVSRCPFTGVAMVYPIDDEGLDGLWWRFDDPVRPTAALPPSVIAVTGAVRRSRKAKRRPFISVPGPEAPYVVPDLLVAGGTAAVLSQIPIGSSTGWVIVYYAARLIDDPVIVPEWGSRWWTLSPRQGPPYTTDLIPHDLRLDFDLEQWIDAGRLRWIAPGDVSLELHSDVDGCPYLEVSR